MKIAFAVPTHYYEPSKPSAIPGGLTVYTKGIAEALVKEGHEVSVLVPDWAVDTKSPYKFNGVHIWPLPSGTDLAFAESIHYWLCGMPQDLIEAHQWAFPLLIEQLLGGTPTVVRSASGLLDIVDSGKWPADELPKSFMGSSRQFHWSRHNAENFTMANADMVLAAGDKASRRALEAGAEYVMNIPLGLEHVDEEKKQIWGTVLIMIGRFEDPRKGGEMVYPILSRIPEKIPVTVLGTTGPPWAPDKAREASLQAEAPRDAKWIFQPLPIKDLRKLYHESLAVISPTKSESFGYVLLEPMAHGTPVICFDQEASKSDWPLIRLGPVGSASLDNIPRALEAVESKKQLPSHLLEFARGFLWDELVPKYQIAYERAIGRALTKGRRRGW